MDGYALTVKQPWAAMIVSGVKPVEYRTWRTGYRGRLYIHAALRLDADAPEWDGPPLVFGVVLGHVELTEVTEGADGWEWHLAEPVPLDVPVPCQGRLGLWRWKP
jgi:ASCH domain